MAHGPMVLQTQRQLPPRFTSNPPSAARLQAREPSPHASPISNQPSNHNDVALIPTSPGSLIQMEALKDKALRFFYSNNTATTSDVSGSGSQVQTTGSSTQQSRRPFTPFGIPARRTRARYNEICPAFVNPTSWCIYGPRCYRIHPNDQETYRRKMLDALAVDSADTAAGSSHEQERETKNSEPDATSDLSTSLLLSDASKQPPEVPPDAETINLPPLESTQGGWGPNGSWTGASMLESWASATTTSPANSNDLLPPASSGSSSPTTASPALSDDGKEEDPAPTPTPTPAPPRSRGTVICVMFKKSGKCPRGKECIFRHVQETTAPPSESPSPEPRPDSTVTPTPTPTLPTPSLSTKAPICSVSTSPAKSPPLPEGAAPAKIPAPSEVMSPVKTPVTSATTSYSTTPVSTVVTPPIKAPVPPMPAVPVQSTTPVAPVRPPERSTPPPPVAQRSRPQSKQVCRRWLQNLCPYGYSCRWVHGDLEYDDEPAKLPPPAPSDDFLLSMTLHDHMRVQCSAGFDIQRIQTAFESSTLLVSNISSRLRPKQLRETLSSYGIVEELRMPPSFSTGTVVQVTYSDATEAQKAQDALNGTKMFGLTITAKVANSGNITAATNVLLRDTAIRISLEAPAKEVYAGYSNKEDAERAIQIARDSPLNGHFLRGQIYEGMPAVDVVNVRFGGVPANVDKADLVRFVNPVDVMWTRPNYEKLEDAIRLVNYRLREYGPESVEFLPPPYRDGGMVRAWVNFPNVSKAKEAARRLDGWRPKQTGYTPIRATHVQSLSYQVSQERWDKFGAGIDMLQASYRGKLATVHISKRDIGGRFVRLSGDDQKELAHLKNQFEQILKGEVVRCDGKDVYNSYFTRREGEEFLRDLSTKNPFIHYENNTQRSHILLHGHVAARVRFANAIVAKVKEFNSQQKFEIPLPGRLLGAVVGNADLRNMQKGCGLDNAHLDVQRRVLHVRGDWGLYQKFKTAVDQIEQRIPKAMAYNGPTCPICFDRPSSPIPLQCGDVWCRGCITHYFQCAKEQRMFPLKCLGKEGRCGTKIPIAVVKRVLSESELEATVTAAFLAHVIARPKEFHSCPTLDCPQVYRSTPQKATLQCPSCLTSICTRCNAEAHDEFQCSDQVQDELFKKWIKEHDVKHCPTCDVPIERVEGCNHMTCTRCQTHICWQCMKTFPGGEGIYGHMREVHGTFGLGAVFG